MTSTYHNKNKYLEISPSDMDSRFSEIDNNFTHIYTQITNLNSSIDYLK